MSSSATEVVAIKSATLSAGDQQGEHWSKDKVRLTMMSSDNMKIEFDLDAIAVTLLALTTGPALQVLKTRAEAQDGPLPGPPSLDFGGGA